MMMKNDNDDGGVDDDDAVEDACSMSSCAVGCAISFYF